MYSAIWGGSLSSNRVLASVVVECVGGSAVEDCLASSASSKSRASREMLVLPYRCLDKAARWAQVSWDKP